ncbi:adenylate/guanylate cyclase domain-containing protein [Hyphomicrobium sp.]|uniref:adenylate/guanylate cyclase domain-containing protein n=1 Tax=Hyphomicrobium sp. TaxID=82 RepID=UPI000FB15F13|nr:adenylate/guanylate cyclase domain-containing protein [Hyphomicrobium sp.]RUP07944.1 MAG: adenylate/guanylate cyclase domain-containing protein [Hyphomicrobium sp.]
MGLADDLTSEVGEIFRLTWDIQDAKVIPDPDDVRLGNHGKKLDATVLYADLADSTDLVNAYPTEPFFPAEIYKAYLTCAARIIRERGGEITAYDGDRIMGIFKSDTQNNDAVRAAFQINGAVTKIINPKLKAQYPNRDFTVRHAVGIDTGSLLAARIGVRNYNDLVWVGRPANYAAKLCSLRVDDYATWITGEVFDQLYRSAKVSSDGREYWEQRQWTARNNLKVYRSSWWWGVDHNPAY